MYILGVDSSTGPISVTVNKGQQLLSKIEYNKNQKYMVSIISLIDKALNKANIDLDSVDLFAVNIGPGDFTGTRIGISVVKTLAWVEKKPVYGIESLDITALSIFFNNLSKIQKLLKEGKQIIISPVLDVKRNEVFFSFYKLEEFKVHAISSTTIQNKNYFINKLSGGHLAESKVFPEKFSGLFIPDNGHSPYIIFGGSGFYSYKHLASDVMLHIPSTGKSFGAFNGEFTGAITGAKNDSGITIFPDKRILSLNAFYLNLCAYYNYLRNSQESPEEIPDYYLDDYSLAPLYVREFAPFKP